MEVFFRDKKLEKLAWNPSLCKREMGTLRAKLFLIRLSDLYKAPNLEFLRHYPGHWHELTRNRKGQWACDLDQPYRLIFTVHEGKPSHYQQGSYIWAEIDSVDILEITNYHGK